MVSTWGSGYTCQGDEQGVAIHFSHTARGEGGPRDPRACLGHLQVMKEETVALHSEQHMHTASNQNQMARRPRKEWAYSPCTASPAGLLIATRSSVQKNQRKSAVNSCQSIREWVYVQSNHPCTTPCCFLLPEVLPCVTERLHTGKTYTNAVHGDRRGPLRVATGTSHKCCRVRFPPDGQKRLHSYCISTYMIMIKPCLQCFRHSQSRLGCQTVYQSLTLQC